MAERDVFQKISPVEISKARRSKIEADDSSEPEQVKVNARYHGLRMRSIQRVIDAASRLQSPAPNAPTFAGKWRSYQIAPLPRPRRRPREVQKGFVVKATAKKPVAVAASKAARPARASIIPADLKTILSGLGDEVTEAAEASAAG